MKERFVVGSVTGYPISAATIDNGHRANPKPRSVWYVYDRPFGYAIVGEFRSAKRKGGFRGEVISGEEQARTLAERLNRLGVPEVLVAEER